MEQQCNFFPVFGTFLAVLVVGGILVFSFRYLYLIMTTTEFRFFVQDKLIRARVNSQRDILVYSEEAKGWRDINYLAGTYYDDNFWLDNFREVIKETKKLM